MNDAKSLAHQVRTSVFLQNGDKFILREVIDFDIVVAAILAQKRIAHPAAHQESPAARFTNFPSDRKQATRNIRFVAFTGKSQKRRHYLFASTDESAATDL